MTITNRAVLYTAQTLGLIAGLLGMEHGIHEIGQGNISTPAEQFNANGFACVPESVWHYCQPCLGYITTRSRE